MYLVVFRNRKRDDIDPAAYADDAAAMERLAQAQPGYLSFKSYVAEDGEVVALSEWTDEAAAGPGGKWPSTGWSSSTGASTTTRTIPCSVVPSRAFIASLDRADRLIGRG